ncbi:hypothetical protein [Bradyrhizobium centrosematis]|uniref:hypothetical protein n=1 Tax=Bradyrhizobium centrosematis TaxID=1300039 RepID=UPI00216819DE|nr:hypothetical protein [Bradyrhizobium centrosematis]MCS3758402.1 hypothetical protein [Bradyrhizobium centrosematis]MCS3773709.1 hypothetical protein [Bradyrhizobium centrosematis]
MIGMTGRVPTCAAIVWALLVLPAVAESSPEWKCTAFTEIPTDERIAACTSVLDSGKFGDRGVISARFNRAGAYTKKGAFELAVADYTELTRLFPRNPMPITIGHTLTINWESSSVQLPTTAK